MDSNTETSYAIVSFSGTQYKVTKGSKITVNSIPGEVGSSIKMDEVLMVRPAGESAAPTIGTPTVSGASVSAKIVAHKRGPKVIIFKKKRRKGYTKKQGHRQDLTELVIESIPN